MTDRPHVWIVGFPRTGTTSLAVALRTLGWNPIDNPRHWDHLDGHDAAADVFATAHWRELLALYPDSRLVLSTRSFDDWVVSLRRIPGFWRSRRAFDRYHRLRVYGTDDVRDERALRRAWDRHHAAVTETVPPDRLLVLPQPFAWGPLCRFLGVAVPDVPFPHLNRLSCDDVPVRLPEAPPSVGPLV
jgi:hypothetical protein